MSYEPWKFFAYTELILLDLAFGLLEENITRKLLSPSLDLFFKIFLFSWHIITFFHHYGTL